MLTSSRSQRGEGKLEELNPNIGKKKVSEKMAGSNQEEAPETKRKEQFQQMFLNMKRIIGKISEYMKTRDATSSLKGMNPSKDRKEKLLLSNKHLLLRIGFDKLQ